MEIRIDNIKIKQDARNEVTSQKIFKGRKFIDSKGNLLYHPDGIFSPRIFGNFTQCNCGALTKPGYCEICETRVIRKSKMPNFYIEFENTAILNHSADFSDYKKLEKKIKNLLSYDYFLYNNNIVKFDLHNINLTDYDVNNIYIGVNAIKKLGVSQDWIYNNTHNRVFVPHPMYRPLTIDNDKIFLGDININLVELLKKRNKVITLYNKGNIDNIFAILSLNKEIISYIDEFYQSLFTLIKSTPNSINKHEMKGQKITGAVRAVVINNFELPEDQCIIGYFFIRDLFPHLYEKYLLDESTIDVAALNEELKDYMVLINRPPTIGEKSIMAFHPQFSLNSEERFVLQINPLVQDGYAGDFDGDVYLIVALYTQEACNEAKRLLPSNNYLGGANGEIRNSIFEDLEYVMQIAYKNGNNDEINSLIEGK